MSCGTKLFRCLQGEKSIYEPTNVVFGVDTRTGAAKRAPIGCIGKHSHRPEGASDWEKVRREQRSMRGDECYPSPAAVSPRRQKVFKKCTSSCVSDDALDVDDVTSRNTAQHLRGLLSLNIEVQEDDLRVYVGGGRHLQPRGGATPGYYVQVSIIPHFGIEDNTLVSATKRQQDPIFHEVFDIRCPVGLRRPRLLLEVKALGDDLRSSLVGCMSFGLKPLIARRKAVAGWFQLLNEDVGHRKHLRVSTFSRQPEKLRAHPEGRPQIDCQVIVGTPSEDTGYMCAGEHGYGDSTGSFECNHGYTDEISQMSSKSGFYDGGCSETTNKTHCSPMNSFNNESLPASSLYASWTSLETTSDYGTCSSFSADSRENLSSRAASGKSRPQVPLVDSDYYSARSRYDDEKQQIWTPEEDWSDDNSLYEGMSENWDFLAAFDNFHNSESTTRVSLDYTASTISGKKNNLTQYWYTGFI